MCQKTMELKWFNLKFVCLLKKGAGSQKTYMLVKGPDSLYALASDFSNRILSLG